MEREVSYYINIGRDSARAEQSAKDWAVEVRQRERPSTRQLQDGVEGNVWEMSCRTCDNVCVRVKESGSMRVCVCVCVCMCVFVSVCDSSPKQPVSVNVRRNTERCIMVSIIDRFLPRGLVTAPLHHSHTHTQTHIHQYPVCLHIHSTPVSAGRYCLHVLNFVSTLLKLNSLNWIQFYQQNTVDLSGCNRGNIFNRDREYSMHAVWLQGTYRPIIL